MPSVETSGVWLEVLAGVDQRKMKEGLGFSCITFLYYMLEDCRIMKP